MIDIEYYSICVTDFPGWVNMYNLHCRPLSLLRLKDRQIKLLNGANHGFAFDSIMTE